MIWSFYTITARLSSCRATSLLIIRGSSKNSKWVKSGPLSKPMSILSVRLESYKISWLKQRMLCSSTRRTNTWRISCRMQIGVDQRVIHQSELSSSKPHNPSKNSKWYRFKATVSWMWPGWSKCSLRKRTTWSWRQITWRVHENRLFNRRSWTKCSSLEIKRPVQTKMAKQERSKINWRGSD